MKVSMIVAMDQAGGIGHHGRLPWRLSTDLRRFKALTMGHSLIMGRKTYESIGRALPGRTLYMVTRQVGYQAPGCRVVHSLDEALATADSAGENEVFVIGGGELYSLALPLAERLYLTRVHSTVPADIFFPKWDTAEWILAESTVFPAGARDQFATTYEVWERLY